MVTVNSRKKIMGSEDFDYEFKGLSTDDKPTEHVAVNSLFLEVDTLDIYYFDGDTWNKSGGE